MNWDFILWIGGAVATIYLVKFLLELLKSLFGKEARRNMIDGMGESIHTANEMLTEKLKRKAAERKQKKKEENKAVVYIR